MQGAIKTSSIAPPPTNNPMLQSPAKPKELTKHLSGILTQHGSRGDQIVASVQAVLQQRYRVAHPIQMAVDAIKPSIKYYKSKGSRAYYPMILFPQTSESIALRWIVQAARGRKYIGDRPDIVRGLVDEFESIIQGTSNLFRKRFDTHRNPN